MKLSEFKKQLKELRELMFKLPNGQAVPSHFHVTEVGLVNKSFIDCGGVMRQEKKVNFQLWEAEDYDHRLSPSKLLNIIEMAEQKLNLQDEAIEVEYQGNTIEVYGVEFVTGGFELTSKFTDCLAKDNCGVEVPKQKVRLADLNTNNSCSPGGGCC